ncbi:hypothetical protein NP233_g2640 [Leucocoprinus birnbaumii]|uniref:Uncharacterized protein n=1 Tax=Leucocoprinus birnbaumii TaxID=56174 RepID=A0AAD5VZZ0_9AGAR|nr:hypothetical protein NP233_g2640 [Leucocoprinus birnbaumii]
MSLAPPPGIYVSAVVFFDDDNELDIDSIRKHVLRLAQCMDRTGRLSTCKNLPLAFDFHAIHDGSYRSSKERIKVIRYTRKALDENGFEKTLVIAGTGAQSPEETIQLCKDAKEAGASHALVLTPPAGPNMMSDNDIINFHTRVANGSPIPTMIFNSPTVTAGLNLNSNIIARLATHPNIVGTKLSCGNIGKLHRLASRFPSNQFALYTGRSDTYILGLHGGGAGAIAVLANLVPRLHAKLYELWKDDNIQEAMRLQVALSHGDGVIPEIGGIGGIKYVIAKHFGYGSPRVRESFQEVNVPCPPAPAPLMFSNRCTGIPDSWAFIECLLEQEAGAG